MNALIPPGQQWHRPTSSEKNRIVIELSEEARYDVFRCRPSKTLETANKLTRLGVDTWIPVSKYSHRLGKGRPSIIRTVPVLPSYLFVPSVNAGMVDRLADDLQVRGVAPMIFNGKRVHVEGARLVPLLPARKGKPVAKLWSEGQRVTIGDPAWSGLSGAIRRVMPSSCTVEMDSGKMASVPYFLLRSVRI